MDREEVPEANQPDTDPAALPPESQQVSTTPPQIATNEQLQQTGREIEDRMSKFERSTVRLTQISIGLAIIVGLAVFAQWYEMHSAGKQTDRLLCLYQRQADALKESADAAMLAAETAKGSFDLTRKQAEDTMEAICQVDFGFSEDNPPSWTANLINEGKMTAKKYQLNVEFSRMSLPDKRTISHAQTYDFSDVPELFPTVWNRPAANQPFPFLRTIPLDGRNKPDLAALNDTKEAEIARYSLSYDNGFGTVITRKACVAHLKSPYLVTNNHWNRVPCEELDRELGNIEARRKAIQKSQKPN